MFSSPTTAGSVLCSLACFAWCCAVYWNEREVVPSSLRNKTHFLHFSFHLT
jgi:hypothetical protein